jgi:pilus assembly protein CpaC
MYLSCALWSRASSLLRVRPGFGCLVAFAPIAITYRRFGVQLTFMPTVLKNGLINLRLMPEVSELDFMIGITIAGTTVPGFTTRKAQTTIELRDGQCFAFAGTLQTTGSVQCRCSGRCSAASRSNPHLIAPAPPGQRMASPTDQLLPSNDVDFLGQMEAKTRADGSQEKIHRLCDERWASSGPL